MSRGAKKPNLRDLSSKIDLNLHTDEALSEFNNQSDRGAALIGAAMADEFLKNAMKPRFVTLPDFDDVVFNNENAPLRTMSSRVKVARALAVIGPKAESHFDIIRRIRNQFAHSMMKIDFNHPLIAQECEKLRGFEGADNANTSTRDLYIGTVVALCLALGNLATRDHENVILLGLD